MSYQVDVSCWSMLVVALKCRRTVGRTRSPQKHLERLSPSWYQMLVRESQASIKG